MATRSLGQLTMDLVLKLGGFTAGMNQAERELNKRAASINKQMAGITSNVKKAFAFLGAGFIIRQIVTATAEAERSLALLDNAVKASGGAAGRTTTQLADMATELQKVTTFSDEAVQGAEQLLLRFQSIQGLNFDRALTSTLDLATALGKDLPAAALLIGKALENPIKGLTQLERSGVVLEKSQRDVIKRLAETGRGAEAQALLLDELDKRYRGAAEAARNTFGGALTGLKNAVGDLLEAKGGLPELTAQINQLTDTLNNPNTKKGVDSLLSGLARIGGVAIEVLSEVGSLGEILGRWQADVAGNLSRIDELEGEILDLDRAINGSFMAKPLPWLFKNAEELKAMRDATLAQIAALKQAQGLAPAGSAAPPGGGTPDLNLPSEEFQKMAERLREQIALHGKVGEAAKIAYQIQTGGLDEMSGKEQQHVLALAEQYDSLVRLAEMAKTQIAAMNELAASIADTEKQFADSFNRSSDEELSAVSDGIAAAAAAGWEQARETITTSWLETNEFMLEAMRNTQDIVADGLVDAMNGSFGDILGNFEQMLQKMVAQAIAADINTKIFGKDGAGGGWLDKGIDFLGGLFGRAGGGATSAGMMYRVNEGGVEALRIPGQQDYLLMGRQSGEVIPSSRAGGGGGMALTQNIIIQGTPNERTPRQLALESSRKQTEAMRFR